MDLIQALPPSIQEALAAFDHEYSLALDSQVSGIAQGTSLVRQNNGKRIRPLLVLLVAAALGREGIEVVNGAVFVELLHVATLVHDDVVDESHMRRGNPSLNARLGNQKAVLIGDYILSVSISKAVETKDLRVMHALAGLGKELAEGEFRQMDASQKPYPTLDEYFAIIRSKTASLLSTCCAVGAILSQKADDETIEGLRVAGEYLGIAFQIKDDILDYTASKRVVGKPVGSDLREHKVTAPLLYALGKDTLESREMSALLSQEHLCDADIYRLIAYASEQGGVAAAETVAQEYVDGAKERILRYLPSNDYRDALLMLCDYAVNRYK